MKQGEIRVFDGFHIEIDRKQVMDLIDCYPESPVYEDTLEELMELEPVILGLVKAEAIVALSNIEETVMVDGILSSDDKVLYAILTIGREASEFSRRYFDEGDYLKGMLADALADTCLFSMEKEFRTYIKSLCLEIGMGIDRRLEAPVDIPMEFQQIAFAKCRAAEYLDMDITVGYMLEPVKSTCQLLRLCEDVETFKLEHNCRSCPNTACKLRKVYDVELHIYSKAGDLLGTVTNAEGETILESLVRGGIYIPAPCGGSGNCGKCQVRVDEETQVSLACKRRVTKDCDVHLLQNHHESEMEVVGVLLGEQTAQAEKNSSEYGIAIDLGTTTIAMALVDLKSGGIVDTYTTVNRQRAYGGDVISRIQASNDGKGEVLRTRICEDLLQGMKSLVQGKLEGSVERAGMPYQDIESVVIAGNTTMLHLLLGFSCDTLGVAPFTPIDIRQMTLEFQEVFQGEADWRAKVTILPGISTYVGADIVSGIYDCEMMKGRAYSLLVDLGTNGEMVLGNSEKAFVTSTAMGPAFEGGNITWGMAGVQGAISGVTIEEGEARLEIIGGGEAEGICGTGVLEIVAELLREELVDETGLLDDEYFEAGYPLAKAASGEMIVLTQKGIREIQLAKAAIRAGVETLIETAGISYAEVETIYLAGGFGYKINREKAVALGMFAEESLEKIKAVGNTSLGGAIKYLLDENGDKTLEKIVEAAEEVDLAMNLRFQELYVECMLLGTGEDE